ncbi:GGDEF domain-containing protein [Streptomyces sp. JJ36]|uniref:GGDEF domain-containing protein n=1 Tax=Streptomyces sp. JJ36 TaxID=2736645 RepID=UPI001F3983B7|nr:GGDEF domain-containing protein [Streptomyces sp. JJ36]MCF6525673.1 GGDEF domain-containing protein [Streptomyces sp. JJ36]
MSALLPAAATAAPLVTGWTLHTVWMGRRLDRARRDPLTGLHTRALFEKRARRLLRGGPCAVVVVDLDGFKHVNDTYGHAAGDTAIRAAGGTLADAIEAEGRGGIVARLGGDEFAAAVPTADPVALRWLLGGLHDALCTPLRVDGRDLTFGASLGAVWHEDQAPADLSRLLRLADEAMYGAKRNGGGWQVAHDHPPVRRTVNGRREGRSGAHTTAPEGGGRR